MALPSDVTKATGLAPALEAVGVTAEATIGVGDAANDLVFCGGADLPPPWPTRCRP